MLYPKESNLKMKKKPAILKVLVTQPNTKWGHAPANSTDKKAT
jgi:hypothetical protein